MRFLLCFLAIALAAGCSTIQYQSRKAGRTIAHVGDRIGEGAETAGRKTRSFWQRMFSRNHDADESSGGTSSRTSDSSSGTSATFDTYAEEHVGD